MSVFTSVTCTNVAGFYLEMFLQYLKGGSKDREMVAKLSEGFFPFCLFE